MHDSTYPLYAIFSPLLFDKKQDEMLGAYASDFLNPFLEKHKQAKEELRLNLKEKLLEFLPKIKIDKEMIEEIKENIQPEFAHNILSALNLWELKNKSEIENELLCTELACQTILLHHPTTSHLEFEKITFQKYPLAFLLILLDEIQEWGRPVVLPGNMENFTKIEKSIELKEIIIRGLFKKKADPENWIFDRKEMEITLDYSNNKSIQIVDIINLKEKKEANLNRLNIGDAKLPNIIIKIISDVHGPEIINLKKIKYQ
jgi:hypothetical protein